MKRNCGSGLRLGDGGGGGRAGEARCREVDERSDTGGTAEPRRKAGRWRFSAWWKVDRGSSTGGTADSWSHAVRLGDGEGGGSMALSLGAGRVQSTVTLGLKI